MREYRKPRRFSLHHGEDLQVEKRRFDFHKYRRKKAIQPSYLIWLFLVFAVVIFLVRYMSHLAR